MRTPKSMFNKNKLKNFIIYAHSFGQMMIPDYFSKFSKYTFTNLLNSQFLNKKPIQTSFTGSLLLDRPKQRYP